MTNYYLLLIMQFVGLNAGLDNGDYFIFLAKLINLFVVMFSVMKFAAQPSCKKYGPISICRRE